MGAIKVNIGVNKLQHNSENVSKSDNDRYSINKTVYSSLHMSLIKFSNWKLNNINLKFYDFEFSLCKIILIHLRNT